MVSSASEITGIIDYNADDLEHLSDLEHVRERPSMYIGDTTPRGLHHLVYIQPMHEKQAHLASLKNKKSPSLIENLEIILSEYLSLDNIEFS